MAEGGSRFWKAVAACLILVLLAGCSEATIREARRKFVRKRKPKPRQVHFFEEKYVPEFPNATLYNSHFVYWKSWQQDWIEALTSGNYKKQKTAAELSLSELKQMQKYLMEAKAGELEKYVQDVARIHGQVMESAPSPAAGSRMRTDLDRLRRIISREFYFKKVRDSIKPDVMESEEETGEDAEPEMKTEKETPE